MLEPNRFALLGRRIRSNLRLYSQAKENGFEYFINPESLELHRISDDDFWGSHNLTLAKLEDFIALRNVGHVPVDVFRQGTQIPVYDLETGALITFYRLNKCAHCYPDG